MATTSSSKRQLIHTSNTYESNTDLTVAGDLTVNGSTTTINTATLNVEDKNVILGNVSSPSDTTADAGGITLKGASDYTIQWTDATNSWHYNQGITVGENDTGHDVKFYGATSNRYLHWNQAEDRLNLRDNTKFSIGNSNDLQLEFNGTHGYIKNNVGGSLYIQTANTIQLESSAGEDMITCAANGAVQLYHDNGHRLSTTVDGISLHGNGYVDLPDNGRLRLGTNNDMMFYHNGSSLSILDFHNHDGLIRNLTNDKLFIFQTTSGGAQYEILRLGGSGVDARFSQHVSIGSSGVAKDLTAYGSTSARYMKWDGSADLLNFMDNVKITIGNSNDLQLYHNGSHSYIKDEGTGGLVHAV